MGIFRELIGSFTKLFKWWIVVAPWERAVLVRLGKTTRVLDPGIHIRIPFLDRIYRQSVRLRYADLPIQTLTTTDGKAVTLSGMVRYTIADIGKLYDTLHHAEVAISGMAMSAIAAYVATHTSEECSPSAIESHTTDGIDLSRYGLGDVAIQLSDFAYVRTYRIISQDNWYFSGDSLDTNKVERDGRRADY